MSDIIAEALRDVLDSLDTVKPKPQRNETIGEILSRAPRNHPCHKLMARLWVCKWCQRRGSLADLFIEIGGPGNACPRCASTDIVMLEDAGASA